jgi:hypothetical protein
MADREGNELHPSPVSFKNRNERGVLLGIFLDLNVAAEVPTEGSLYDDEGELFRDKRGKVWGGSVWGPSCVDEIRSCAMSVLE